MTLRLVFPYRSHTACGWRGERTSDRGGRRPQGTHRVLFSAWWGDSSLAQNEPQQDLTLPQANSEWITSPYVKNAIELFRRKSGKIFEA